MRLTSDLVLQSRAVLNCIGDRLLLLRNLSIPAIENLAVARDSFDSIDLSSNMITTLGDGFPPFLRLSELYLGGNRIATIGPGISESLPNLTTLVLTDNRIATLADLNLGELAKLSRLEILCIRENPLADVSGVREKIAEALPQLKVLDFVKVQRQHARENDKESKRKRKRKAVEQGPPGAKRRALLATYEFQPEKGGEKKESEKPRPEPLSKEMSVMLKKLIAEAKSVDEVARIQQAVRERRVAALLETVVDGGDAGNK